MTTFLIILTIIYLLSAFLCWKWVRISNAPGGINEGKDACISDLVITLMPVVNSLMSLIIWVNENPRKESRPSKSLLQKWINIFFGVKKG